MKPQAKTLIRFLPLLLLLLSAPAFACLTSADCEPGSRCLRPSGRLYGVCAGGLSPGDRYDRGAQQEPRRLRHGNEGATCSFNIDCWPNGVCYKEHGVYGVCLVRDR